MPSITRDLEVRGPWSLAVSRRFWEGFAPNRLPDQRDEALEAAFLADADWLPVRVRIEQVPGGARVSLIGDGDLDAAAGQVARFMALDVDGTDWPAVATRDPVIAEAQAALPGFRPCGFYSPFEAAVWSILSQRVRLVQAAALRRRLADELGREGAFPSPAQLRGRDLGLPGRKGEYLDAVCEVALDGLFDGAALRAMDADAAIDLVQQVKGIGPFAASLIVVRGVNHPDALPRNEGRLEAEIARRYGAGAVLEDVAAAWRPFRTWAGVSLRALAPAAAMPA